jgi:hypothetical protein
MDMSSLIRRKTLRLFESRPDIFANIISIHTSKPIDRAFDMKAVVGLGWRVLWT